MTIIGNFHMLQIYHFRISGKKIVAFCFQPTDVEEEAFKEGLARVPTKD